MITEDYVSFEVAKLLKEKRFDGECSRFYMPNGYGMWKYEHYHDFDISDRIECPTIQMAMKWLRKVHNLFIFPFPQRNTDNFWAEIYSIDKDKNENDKWENLYCESIDLQDYPTYEETCEEAIKYCLENLI